jgi:hypothetical protein
MAKMIERRVLYFCVLVNAFSKVVPVVTDMSIHRIGADADGVGVLGVARRDVADADLIGTVIIVIVTWWGSLALTLGPALAEVLVQVELVDLLLNPVLADPDERFEVVVTGAVIGAALRGVTGVYLVTDVGATGVSDADIGFIGTAS